MENELSAMLKELRDHKGLKQKEVAESLSLAQRTYSRYENGEREPDINTLINIANFFNVPLDILVGRYKINNRTK